MIEIIIIINQKFFFRWSDNNTCFQEMWYVCHLKEEHPWNWSSMWSWRTLWCMSPIDCKNSRRSRLGSSSRACSGCCRSGTCVILALETLRWLSNPPCLTRSYSHYMWVNCAGDAILHLGIELREHISIIDASLLDIPHGRLFHDVTDEEPLHSLVLDSSTVQ